ncbi:hypothetical protein O181_017362 [Austropuccinia psidii MF-1]|uniref:Tf2-1-like SH3-like domain-containing protein n=1 Tax=Austropuccinia psidii MF-1 TaxID=1389203 RepID=A0A9Q3C7G3_9BASI|nr:hypothetical protein [Austropuccinia psidii MF-1]
MPVNNLKKNLQSIHPTAKDFHDYMQKIECDTVSRCIAEAKEYKKQRYDKTHKEPEFREGDQVLVYTLNLKNLKGQKRMRHSFLRPFTIMRLIGENTVKVRLTEEIIKEHPVFPVSLVKPYHQKGEDTFPFRNKSHTPQYIAEVEDFSGPVKKIIKARKIRLKGKDHRQYFVRFKNQTAD